MPVSNNKTSYLISSQVPQFVRDDHETFVQFLEEYYKFLAQEGQVEYVAKNFMAYMDIDILDEHIQKVHTNIHDYQDYHAFLQKMYENFIRLIPAKVLADRSLILKHAKDFYRARGSEKSVRFLLRILLGKEVNEDFGFYYPKRDILRASDGKWLVEKSIRIRDISVNNVSNTTAYSNFVNKTIRGLSSNATAIVETVDTYYDKGLLITELKLSSSIRAFINGEKVFCYYTEEGTDKYLTANLFSGIVTSVSLANGGTGYIEGAYIPVEGGGGSGAQVVIASTTKGTLAGVGVVYGGAGFRSNDSILVSGGGGTGAMANVLSVNTSGLYHSNTYNIVASIIALEANTAIGNARYSNLVSSIVDPANAWISNSMSAWTFANCGPIESCFVINSGNNYSVIPTLSVQGNTVIKSLGILGRLEIIDGGLNYQVGNKLQFINPFGSYGSGASANVTAVAANGKITQVKFEALPGEISGGAGYDLYNLPSVNVSTTTGNGANIIVKSLLGYGDNLTGSTGAIGTIVSLKLVSGGSGYTSAPTLNLANMTMGTGGVATATIATGAYTYPGRYINDDGHLSSFNFLEDRDYYQNYSYVVRVNASLKDYRKPIRELTHPAGTRLFGQYLIPRDDVPLLINTETSASNSKLYISTYKVQTSDVLKNGVYNVKTIGASYQPDIRQGTYVLRSNVSASYDSRNKTVVVNSPSHWLRSGDNVFLQFSNASANVTNGYYTITSTNTNYFVVSIKNGNTSFVVLPTNTSNLTANTGYGNTNSYVTLTQWSSNSNVNINVGDSVNIGGNLVSVVYTNLSSNTIIVSPALPGNLVANTVRVQTAPYNAYGNVKIYDPIISLFVGTSQIAGDNVFVQFSSSNTALANDRYTLLSANSNVLKIRHRDIVSAGSFSGNVNVHTKTVTVTSTGHNLANNESVFILFYTGDTSNTSNGLYVVRDASQNTFNITAANSVTTSGLATIKTSNLIMNVTSHGFTTNNSVYIWFTSGDTANLENGYYTVTVLNSNQFSLIHDTIPTSNGNLTVYRNYMNVTINRTNHGFSLGSNVAVMFETGDLANIANGIYLVNSVANTNTYNIMHNAITISGNISNVLSNTSGTVYVSVV